jgi:hypothetical protein
MIMTNNNCSCPNCDGSCKKQIQPLRVCSWCGHSLPFSSAPCLNCTYYNIVDSIVQDCDEDTDKVMAVSDDG